MRIASEMPCFNGECNLHEVLASSLKKESGVVSVECMSVGFIADRIEIGDSEGCPFQRMASFVTQASMEAAAKEVQNA